MSTSIANIAEKQAGMETRIVALEQILFGVKIAAGILGFSALSLCAWVVWTVSSIDTLETETEAAKSMVQKEGRHQIELLQQGWDLEIFPVISSEDPKKTALGPYPACFLVEARTVHSKQACGCRVLKENEVWALELTSNPNIDGRCTCGAACLKSDAG